MNYEYECALTGTVEGGADSFDGDGLGDLPPGWTQITMKRRQYNPKWVLIQQVKEAMIEGLVQQFPPEIQEIQKYAVGLQVEAQFHGLERETPMYLLDIDDTVFISDSGEVVESLNEAREMMGLEPLLIEEDSEEDVADESNLPHDSESGDE